VFIGVPLAVELLQRTSSCWWPVLVAFHFDASVHSTLNLPKKSNSLLNQDGGSRIAAKNLDMFVASSSSSGSYGNLCYQWKSVYYFNELKMPSS
jgi:hypothetical protein